MMVLALLFGGASVMVGFAIAWYAQGKIDKQRQDMESGSGPPV